MREFELMEAMSFKSGRFKLTPEQLANRRYVVRFVGDPSERLVEPITEISFKRGEFVTTDFEVPKSLEAKIRPLVTTEVPQSLEKEKGSAATGAPGGGPTGTSQGTNDGDDPLSGIDDAAPRADRGKPSATSAGKKGK